MRACREGDMGKERERKGNKEETRTGTCSLQLVVKFNDFLGGGEVFREAMKGPRPSGYGACVQ